MEGPGSTIEVKYSEYHRPLVTTQNSGYDRFPPEANGWGFIHPVLDKAPTLQAKEGATNLKRTNLKSNPHHRLHPTALDMGGQDFTIYPPDPSPVTT
jgi:hypothetical protein